MVSFQSIQLCIFSPAISWEKIFPHWIRFSDGGLKVAFFGWKKHSIWILLNLLLIFGTNTNLKCVWNYLGVSDDVGNFWPKNVGMFGWFFIDLWGRKWWSKAAHRSYLLKGSTHITAKASELGVRWQAVVFGEGVCPCTIHDPLLSY